jgi:hypothetical protein
MAPNEHAQKNHAIAVEQGGGGNHLAVCGGIGYPAKD